MVPAGAGAYLRRVTVPSFPDKWSPALQIRTVLLSIQALLSAPNPDDPLANDVAEQWKSSEAEAIKTGEARERARGSYPPAHAAGAEPSTVGFTCRWRGVCACPHSEGVDQAVR